MSTIDRTNRRILALLRADARMGASAIGAAIGLSRQAVQARIKTLEDSGVIRGYHADIAPDAGVHAVTWLKLASQPCDAALDWLSGLQGITALYSLSGEWDVLAHVSLPEAADLSALNDVIGTSPLVARHHSQIVLRHRTVTPT